MYASCTPRSREYIFIFYYVFGGCGLLYFPNSQSPPKKLTKSTFCYQLLGSNQSNSLSVQASEGEEIILPSGHCNYHIKAIRRGIPEIISTDTRGRTRRLIMTGNLILLPY